MPPVHPSPDDRLRALVANVGDLNRRLDSPDLTPEQRDAIMAERNRLIALAERRDPHAFGRAGRITATMTEPPRGFRARAQGPHVTRVYRLPAPRPARRARRRRTVAAPRANRPRAPDDGDDGEPSELTGADGSGLGGAA